MCAAKLLKRNKNNNVAVALATTKRSRNEHPCCNAGGAPSSQSRRAHRAELELLSARPEFTRRIQGYPDKLVWIGVSSCPGIPESVEYKYPIHSG